MFFLVLFLFFITFVYYFWGGLRQGLHMMQLSGYYSDRFLQWVKGRQRKDAMYLMVATVITSLGFRFVFHLYLYLLLHAAAFGLLAFLQKRKRRPDKKPLVYTWRVRRLLLTAVLLCVVFILGLGALFRNLFLWELPFLLAIMNLMVYTLVVIANLLNTPVEKQIAKGFIDDAKRILSEHPGLKVIGITGSYGKTSVKHLAGQMLGPDYQVLVTPESYNTPMGVVRTVRERLLATHQIFLVEMGAKKPGDIKEICDIVRPTMGVITSVGEMHLETFYTLENVADTKFELAQAVEAAGGKGLMFLNNDNEYIRKRTLVQPAVRYGLGREGAGERGDGGDIPDVRELDVWAENILCDSSGSRFDLCFLKGERISCRTRLLGKLNVLNITAAAAVAFQLGVTPAKLGQIIGRLEPVPHRLQLLPPGPLYQIIDDAFNSNPEGAKQALETLAGFPGYKILITPGMVELGDQEEELNRRLGRRAAKCCNFIIIVGENRSIALLDGIRRGGFDESAVYVAADIHDALKKADGLAAELDSAAGPVTVLLENDLPDNYLDAEEGKHGV